jgi:hypothetical protein
MADTVSTVLPQAVGYGVVVGIGFFFTVVMIGISMLQVYVLYQQNMSPTTKYHSEQIYQLLNQDQ